MTRKKLKLLTLILGILLSGYLFFQGLTSRDQFISQGSSPKINQPAVGGSQIASGSAEIDSKTPAGFVSAQVIKVVDGDTIEVVISGQNYKVRYIGIDTPETVDPRRPVGCFGKEASNENKKLVGGMTVFLEKDVSETDKYNRLLRYVYLSLNNGDFLMVNDYLVRQGFAQSYSYPPDVKHQPRFIEAQEEARIANRGLWEKCK